MTAQRTNCRECGAELWTSAERDGVCGSCKGAGDADDCDGGEWVDCWACLGAGVVDVPDDDMTDREEDCTDCNGAGRVHVSPPEAK